MGDGMEKVRSTEELEQYSNGKNKQAPLDEWMKRQIVEVHLSTDKLNERTMEVFTRILEIGSAKAQSTTPHERKHLSEMIQKLEALCDDISNDFKKYIDESIEKISERLAVCMDPEPKTSSQIMKLTKDVPESRDVASICENISKEVAINREDNNELEGQLQNTTDEKLVESCPQIGSFLGRYSYRTPWGEEYYITIGRDAETEFFYCVHSTSEAGEHQHESLVYLKCNLWLPDGVDRNGTATTLEGSRLTITNNVNVYKGTRSYELCESELKYGNTLYLREK